TYLADSHPARFFQYRIKVQPGHRVVTDGPYRYVRHPPHSMITLALAGTALAQDTSGSLLTTEWRYTRDGGALFPGACDDETSALPGGAGAAGGVCGAV